MGSRSKMSCWEIMQCENSDDCPAKSDPTKQCWEIANDSDDYRTANNICRDCIVYVLKAEESSLSQQEIDSILARKVRCKRSTDIRDLLHEHYHKSYVHPG